MSMGMIENNCNCSGDVVDSNNYISIDVFNYDAEYYEEE